MAVEGGADHRHRPADPGVIDTVPMLGVAGDLLVRGNSGDPGARRRRGKGALGVDLRLERRILSPTAGSAEVAARLEYAEGKVDLETAGGGVPAGAKQGRDPVESLADGVAMHVE